MQDGHPDVLEPAAIGRLDKTVAEITATGLVVILDIHPEMPYVMALGQGDASVTNFFKFWQTFATHYASTDPQQVYFEVLNEPHIEDSYRWAGIQSKAVEGIRAVAPHHTIIATGNRWGGVAGLLEVEPVGDDHAASPGVGHGCTIATWKSGARLGGGLPGSGLFVMEPQRGPSPPAKGLCPYIRDI